MQFNGQIHRITNLSQFVQSLVKQGQPKVGFADWGKARVHAVIDLPGTTALPSFFPDISIKVDTDSAGKFKVELPEIQGAKVHFVAFTQLGTANTGLPGIPPVPIFGPIYRSEKVAISTLSAGAHGIFVHNMTLDNEKGIPEKEIRAEGNKLKKQQKLDSLKISVDSNDISVRASKSDAELTFNLKIVPSTSSDLDELLRIKVQDYDLDLPGPDFITGLCVDEDEIERGVRKGVRELAKDVNARILETLKDEAGAAAAFLSQVTVTLRQIRFPVTSTESIKIPIANTTVKVNRRSVVGDPSIGWPRKLA